MQLGRYEVLGKLGAGGMGEVLRARDPLLQAEVALKLLHPGVIQGDDLERFRREAQVLTRLRHPHIVGLQGVGRSEQPPYQPFLVLDLVEGGSLQDLLRAEGPLPAERAVEIARQLAAAVAYAHSQGVVHRDLKPHNVLLERGRGAASLERRDASGVAERSSASAPANVLLDREGGVKLADFGLAKLLTEGLDLTQSSEILGTPAYMAPEQALEGGAASAGPACDVYALGATLYAMLGGRAPFEGNPLQVLTALGAERPVPLGELRPGLDPRLIAIVERAMRRAPEERYASADELREALEDRGHAPTPWLVRAAPALLGLLLVAAASAWAYREVRLGGELERARSEGQAASVALKLREDEVARGRAGLSLLERELARARADVAAAQEGERAQRAAQAAKTRALVALSRDPYDSGSLVQVFPTLADEGEHEALIQLASHVLDRYPASGEALFWRGEAQRRLGRTAGAREDLESARAVFAAALQARSENEAYRRRLAQIEELLAGLPR
ncbi:MAG: serine/threonine-protein kinase [Planctomycetota bacterium]